MPIYVDVLINTENSHLLSRMLNSISLIKYYFPFDVIVVHQIPISY